MEYQFVTVGPVAEIPNGACKVLQVGERSIAVFHLDSGFFAIDESCPHMGASLAEGHVQNAIVTCPWHGWQFDLRDGTWCDNPRVRIGSYRVRIENDHVQVAIPLPDNSAETQRQ